MPRVVTEIDLDLAKEQAKIAQLKLDLKSVEAEARKVKIGENLVTREAAAEAAKIAQLKAQIATAAFEGGLKELAPAQQLYSITQQIARLKAQAYDAGPIREPQALQVELQTGQLAQRRAAIMAGMHNERQQSLALAQRELAVQAQQSAEARRLLGIEEIQNAAAQRRALLSSASIARGGLGGGGGRFAAGQIGLQVQDIAVQLKAGTSPITVLAQQGSQLASIFGPTGKIAGGFIAIGAAVMAMGRANKEAFDNLIKGAQDSETALSRLNGLSSFAELSKGVSSAREQVDALNAARGRLNSWGAMIGGGIAMFSGGETRAVQEGSMILAREKAEQRLVTLQRASLESASRELQIAELRGSSRTYEADQMERAAALQREIAGITKASFDDNTQGALINTAEKIAAVKEQAAWTEELDRRQKKADEEAKAAAAIRLQRTMAEGSEWARIAELKKQAADRDLETALKGLRPLDAAAELERRAGGMASAARDQGPIQGSVELETQASVNRLLERAKELRNTAAQREAAIALSKTEWDLESKLLEAKGKALDKEDATVTALDSKLKAMRLAKQYQDNFNVSAQQALNMASARVTAENNIATAIKQQQQAEAQNNLAQRLKLAQLQGAGRNVAAAKMQAQTKEDDLVKEVQAANPNLTPDQARQQARDLIKAEDRADRRQARNEARENGTPLPRSKIVTNTSRAGAGGLKPLWAQGIGQLAVNQGPAGQQMQQANQNAAQMQAMNSNVFSIQEGASIISLLTTISQNLESD